MAYKMKGFSGFKASAVKQTEQWTPEKQRKAENVTANEFHAREEKKRLSEYKRGKKAPKLEKLAPPPPPIKPLKRRKFQDIERGISRIVRKDNPLKQKQGQADPSRDYIREPKTEKSKKVTTTGKKGKPYFKPSSEVMHPPYRRPVGPTEKRHGVHRGDQLMDNLDTEFQPRKNKYHMKDRLKK